MNEPALPPDTGIQRIDMVQWFTDNRDRMCLLPWLNIHTNTDGKIKLCCNIHLDHFVNKREKDAPVTHFNFGYDDIEEGVIRGPASTPPSCSRSSTIFEL